VSDLIIRFDDVLEKLWEICDGCERQEDITCPENCLVRVLADFASCFVEYSTKSGNYVFWKPDKITDQLTDVLETFRLMIEK